MASRSTEAATQSAEWLPARPPTRSPSTPVTVWRSPARPGKHHSWKLDVRQREPGHRHWGPRRAPAERGWAARPRTRITRCWTRWPSAPGSGTTVLGDINTTPNTTIFVDLYANPGRRPPRLWPGTDLPRLRHGDPRAWTVAPSSHSTIRCYRREQSSRRRRPLPQPATPQNSASTSPRITRRRRLRLPRSGRPPPRRRTPGRQSRSTPPARLAPTVIRSYIRGTSATAPPAPG